MLDGCKIKKKADSNSELIAVIAIKRKKISKINRTVATIGKTKKKLKTCWILGKEQAKQKEKRKEKGIIFVLWE